MIEPASLLGLAFQLATGTTEAEWRSAISRAYYAAYLHFREFPLAENRLGRHRSGRDDISFQQVVAESAPGVSDDLRQLRSA